MAGFDPNEPREAGRWTKGGGGGGDSAVERHLVDPRVTDVGGDEWNKKTADRLEREYAAVRPEIDAIATEGVAVKPSNWEVVAHPDIPGKLALQSGTSGADNQYGLNANGVGINAFATVAEAKAAIATYSPTQSLMEPEEDAPDAAPKEWGDLT